MSAVTEAPPWLLALVFGSLGAFVGAAGMALYFIRQTIRARDEAFRLGFAEGQAFGLDLRASSVRSLRALR